MKNRESFFRVLKAEKSKRKEDFGKKVRLGLSELPPIDPFNDIDPIMEGEPENGNQHLLPITDISPEEFELLCGIRANYIADDESSDEDSEWEENL